MDCPMCHGNGELDCHDCQSVQQMENGALADSRCDRCNGTNIVSCYRCAGSGYLEQYA